MSGAKCWGCGSEDVRVNGTMCKGCRKMAGGGARNRERISDKAGLAVLGVKAEYPDEVVTPPVLAPYVEDPVPGKDEDPGELLRGQARIIKDLQARYKRQWYMTNGRGVRENPGLTLPMLAQAGYINKMMVDLADADRKWREATREAMNIMTPAEMTEEAITWLERNDVALDKKREAVERVLKSLGASEGVVAGLWAGGVQ